jgi:transposase
METLFSRCAGLDVHQASISACVMIGEKEFSKEVKRYGTMTADLRSLKEWLTSLGVTHVAMESTGIYWKPVFNVLEDTFEVVLANARHIKNVPGRKTDVKDCEWICRLMRSGLLRGSFIPPQPIRDLRDLTLYRSKLVQSVSSEKNRILKVLEDTNIKLASVVSNVFGVSGSAMLEALLQGETSENVLADMAKGRLKAKRTELARSLQGNMRGHHREMIAMSLRHIEELGKLIKSLDEKIHGVLAAGYSQENELLQTIPGVDKQTAASIIAGIGVTMDQFKDESHLSSWAGLSPGNNESAGKKKVAEPLMATRD